MKVLIIEDERELAESIYTYMENNDFICDIAPDFEKANQMINLYQYDCIAVDITLPDGSGLEVIKALKKIHSQAGIIIISAKNSLDDKIRGLATGADDYLTKPFHLAELTARINSVIRRRQFDGYPEIIFKEIKIKPQERSVQVNGSALDLTKKEYDLLVYMISNKKQVLTKETIAEHLWGSQIDMVDSFEFIYSHVKNLRKKLMGKGCRDYIKTVYGIGYRLEEK